MNKPKLMGQVTTHMSDADARALAGLADIAGQTTSQYLRELIEMHLQERRREYELMQEVFGSQSSISSLRAEGK